MLVPVKSFRAAKLRLATVLDDDAREALARELASRVIAAAAPLPVLVVCDDEEVATWAVEHGARVAWTPGLGLSAAVMAGVAQLAAEGVELAVVATPIFPLPRDWRHSASLAGHARARPASRRDQRGRRALRAPGSVSLTGRAASNAIAAEAARLGLPCQIVYDRRLAIDIDLPEDLALAQRGNLTGWNRTSPSPAGRSPSARIPTTSSSAAAPHSPSGRRSGCEIFHLICTDGSKGTWDPTYDPAELVVTRRHEQRAASLALGGKGEVIFLGWPDGELEAGLRQRFEVAATIRRLKPEVVLGHDPWKRYRLHPDHRNAGFLVTDGIVAARDPLFFPELADLPAQAEDPSFVRGGRARSSRGRAALSSTRSSPRSWSTGASCARRWASPRPGPPGARSTPRSSTSSAGSRTALPSTGPGRTALRPPKRSSASTISEANSHATRPRGTIVPRGLVDQKLVPAKYCS